MGLTRVSVQGEATVPLTPPSGTQAVAYPLAATVTASPHLSSPRPPPAPLREPSTASRLFRELPLPPAATPLCACPQHGRQKDSPEV